jgi:hypothetical protein
MTWRTEIGVRVVTTRRALMGTRPVASLNRRSMAEDTAETTMIYVMSSTSEMHAAESNAGAEIRSVKSKNSTMKGTIIFMVLTMTNLTRSGHLKQDTSQEVSRHIA